MHVESVEAQTSSHWCGVKVRRGECQLRRRPRHLTRARNYELRYSFLEQKVLRSNLPSVRSNNLKSRTLVYNDPVSASGRPTKRKKMLAENSKKRWQKSSKTVDEKQ
ncbi:hypothetical protein TNCV_2467231 [Trichonephila clavipes]|nr:hypothetical protein TNCV_2467231 [Trichonephila clavipes]